MMNTLLSGGRFDVAAGRSENTSTDAQTASFLGLVGPTVDNGTGTLISPQPLILSSPTYLNHNHTIYRP